ncbi:helix-turn-helix transcriptional regulator, partial [Streptomyces niveus]
DAARLRAEAVVPDLLHPLPATPIDVPDPSDDRVRAVADALLADPADPRGLDAHARAVGVSRRTLSRLFVHDTGMNFDRWRTHARLRAALPLLAEGHPVSRVAHTVGYATPSAFLAAFRRVVGTSPGRYLHGDASFEPPATSAADG